MNAKEVLFVWGKVKMEVSEGAKHKKALFRHDDTVILRTYMSRGPGKLDGIVQHQIRQQMKLDEEQFRLFKVCTYWRDDYVRILKDKGHILNA